MLQRMRAQHGDLEEVSATEKSLQDLCTRHGLAVPSPKPTPIISQEAITAAINQTIEMLVPGSDLLQIALGNREMPTTADGLIKWAFTTALEFLSGGKVLKFFKSSFVRKIEGHILKLATI